MHEPLNTLLCQCLLFAWFFLRVTLLMVINIFIIPHLWVTEFWKHFLATHTNACDFKGYWINSTASMWVLERAISAHHPSSQEQAGLSVLCWRSLMQRTRQCYASLRTFLHHSRIAYAHQWLRQSALTEQIWLNLSGCRSITILLLHVAW